MRRTIMDAESKVKLARGKLPVVGECAYLDTGSVGPITTVFSDAWRDALDEDLRFGRARLERWERIERDELALREELAMLLNARADEIELTRGTSDGVRRLLAKLDFAPGDEIVTTSLEFPSCVAALDRLAAERGVVIHTADVPDSDTGLDCLSEQLSPKTRLIVCSGVAFASGWRLPLGRIVDLANRHGIRTLIDGAQLVGAYPVDLDRIRIDFLAFPLQKWLCGPEGLGGLYVRRGALAHEPGRIAAGWPLLFATRRHLAWLRECLGWDWIHSRTAELADYAQRELADRAYLVTPDAHAGLTAFRMRRGSSQAFFDRARADDIVVRHRPELELLRISTAFFTTEQEIDSVADRLGRAMDIVI